jgi:hypothetical protein
MEILALSGSQNGLLYSGLDKLNRYEPQELLHPCVSMIFPSSSTPHFTPTRRHIFAIFEPNSLNIVRAASYGGTHNEREADRRR